MQRDEILSGREVYRLVIKYHGGAPEIEPTTYRFDELPFARGLKAAGMLFVKREDAEHRKAMIEISSLPLPWHPANEKKYWYLDDTGWPHVALWIGSCEDHVRHEIGNCFKSDSEASAFSLARRKFSLQWHLNQSREQANGQ